MSKFLIVKDEFINLDHVLKIVADEENLTINIICENPELSTIQKYESINFFETAHKKLFSELNTLAIY